MTRISGKLSLRSQPGMDRIFEGLTDVRHNTVNTAGVKCWFLLGLGTVIREDSLVWNLVPGFHDARFCSLVPSYFTPDTVRQMGDEMPRLVHYAPTHHPTQLGSILGELIVLHLDPDGILTGLSGLQISAKAFSQATTKTNHGNAPCTFCTSMRKAI